MRNVNWTIILFNWVPQELLVPFSQNLSQHFDRICPNHQRSMAILLLSSYKFRNGGLVHMFCWVSHDVSWIDPFFFFLPMTIANDWSSTVCDKILSEKKLCWKTALSSWAICHVCDMKGKAEACAGMIAFHNHNLKCFRQYIAPLFPIPAWKRKINV